MDQDMVNMRGSRASIKNGINSEWKMIKQIPPSMSLAVPLFTYLYCTYT